MSGKRCPECGTLYRSTSEILAAGGSCKQIGASLFGWCSCGGDLGGVGRLWKAQRNTETKAKQAQQVKAAMLN